MNTVKSASLAELNDKIMQRVAVVALFMAFTFLVSALQRIVTGEWTEYLNWTEKGAAILLLVFIIFGLIPLCIKKISQRGGQPNMQIDGFINDIALKSFGYAWFATFLAGMLFKTVFEGFINNIPAESLIELQQAVLLGVYGLCFIIMNNADGNSIGSEDV